MLVPHMWQEGICLVSCMAPITTRRVHVVGRKQPVKRSRTKPLPFTPFVPFSAGSIARSLLDTFSSAKNEVNKDWLQTNYRNKKHAFLVRYDCIWFTTTDCDTKWFVGSDSELPAFEAFPQESIEIVIDWHSSKAITTEGCHNNIWISWTEVSKWSPCWHKMASLNGDSNSIASNLGGKKNEYTSPQQYLMLIANDSFGLKNTTA